MKPFRHLENTDFHCILTEEDGDNVTTDNDLEQRDNVEESLKFRRYAIRNLLWYIKLGSLDKTKRNTTIALIALNIIFILIAGAVIAVFVSNNNKTTETPSGLATGSVRLPVMLFDLNHTTPKQFKGFLQAKTLKNQSNLTEIIKVDSQFVYAVKGKAEIEPENWDSTVLYLQRKVYKDQKVEVKAINEGDDADISDGDCVVVQNFGKHLNQTNYIDYIALQTTIKHQRISIQKVTVKEVKNGHVQGQDDLNDNEVSREDGINDRGQKSIDKNMKATLKENKLNGDDSEEDFEESSEEDSPEDSSEEFSKEKFEEDFD